MDRRDFFLRAFGGLALFAGGAHLIAACGQEEESSVEPVSDGDCGTGAATVYINPGHAHTEAGLSAAEVAAAGTYTVLTGDHSHTITLTAGHVATIGAGGSVTLNDNEGHLHDIMISC